MRLIFLSACLLIGVNVLGQGNAKDTITDSALDNYFSTDYEGEIVKARDTVIPVVDKRFAGFDEIPHPGYDFHQYVRSNMDYPDSARNNYVEGKVVVRFFVNKDGSISECKVIRHVSWDLDKEALRVVKHMPKWKPAKKNGKPVKTWFEQPVLFKIDD